MRRTQYLIERLSAVDAGSEQEFRPYAYRCIQRAIERDGAVETALRDGASLATLRKLYGLPADESLVDEYKAARSAAIDRGTYKETRAAYIIAAAILRLALTIARK